MPRTLEEVDAEIDKLSAERFALLAADEIASLPANWRDGLAEGALTAVRQYEDGEYDEVEIKLSPLVSVYVRAELYEAETEAAQ